MTSVPVRPTRQGQGKRQIAGDKLSWKLTIPYENGYVGVTSGSVMAKAEAA
jgi:hypothetical protein